MTVRQILKMGNPGLLMPSEPVTDFGAELQTLVDDLWDTMEANDGAGLAAPQIGVNRRVVVFRVDENPRYPDVKPVPPTVLVNPVIEPLGEDTENGWEGCLSLPGLRGQVPRYRRIRYSGVDEHGRGFEREVEGFHARVAQHECDHLDGILYPMRMPDMRLFGFESELGFHPQT